jgi:parvulin-like peptidyl-prolyl isomerase
MRYCLPIVLCGVALGLVGCPPPAPQERPWPPVTTIDVTSRPAGAGPASPAPNAGAANAAVMATVNGKPIYMEDLVNPLIEANGLQMAEMLVANSLLAQEAAKKNVAITREDAQAEHERTLAIMLGSQYSANDREKLLDELLRRRGLTRGIWDATMNRNAILRKLALPRVEVTDALIQAEFVKRYGEKVQCAHIMLPSVTEAEKIIELLKDPAQDFAALAKRYSTNAETAKDGGLLPQFTKDDAAIPRALREAAFSLKEGQVSGIVQAGGNFHVLKVLKRSTPAALTLESVKDKLTEEVRQQLIEAMQTEILTELRRNADVEFINPILRRTAQKVSTP